MAREVHVHVCGDMSPNPCSLSAVTSRERVRSRRPCPAHEIVPGVLCVMLWHAVLCCVFAVV
jgi:hypothetical protein